MSAKSAIEWTDATWNPVTGCTKVSQGCKNCYAEREWPRLQHLPAYTGRAFTDVRCHPERLQEPLHWRKPRKIFVCHNADLFHESVPFDFICKVIATCIQAEQHTFQILTKRPERMLEWSLQHARERTSWPAPNVWLGVSVEDQATADERIPLLLQTPAAVRWISAEPLLGPISFEGMFANPNDYRDGTNALEELGWVVTGGESGPNARALHPDWARSLRDQCQAAGVPFFFKQWGEWLSGEKYGDTFRWQDGKLQMVRFGRGEDDQGFWDDKKPCAFVGKKAAGRLLDGREWSEYPA